MAFDTNGTFTRDRGVDSWKDDASDGTKILANLHDDNDNDMANALSECLNRYGRGSALADISMGGHRITNLLDGVALTDAANLNQVRNIEGWNTAKYIGGTDLDGRLNFTGTTGVNGITWTAADLSWVARMGKAGETNNRLVMNNSVTPPTASNAGDVFLIDEWGGINNNGYLTSNVSLEQSVAWRTISPGFGTILSYTGGSFAVRSNDVATTTNLYSAFTPREFFSVQNSAGHTQAWFNKNGSGKAVYLWGTNNGSARWRMDFGDGAAESGGAGSYTGSNFVLYAWDNAGAGPKLAFTINRGTGLATVYGDIKVNGEVTTNAYFYSASTTMVLQATANGAVYVRPDGTDSDHQAVFNSVGSLSLCNAVSAATGGILAGMGLRYKLGSTGGYGGHSTAWVNFNWTGAVMNVYAGSGLLGTMTGSWCDYRIKKDIAPLPSMWDRVKALKPIRYTYQAFQMFDDGDDEQWGFLAHEVQDSLGSTMATGEKDGPDVQGLNLLGVIAGLTRALQEAMLRIEALEAAP